MQLESDLLPWLSRPKTDLLGVFMGNAAARARAEAAGQASSESSRITARAVMGQHWQDVKSEKDAYRLFLQEIGGCKRYLGMYPLRKKESQSRAYAIFGASDSEHGFHLLSDAVAYDWGALNDFDFARRERTLFSDMDREAEQQADFARLIELVKPVLQTDPTLTGQKLALALYRQLPSLDTVFGRYRERDFTRAAQACRRSPDYG